MAAMLLAGQVCLAAKRAYIPRALYGAVCDELALLVDAAIVGDGMDEKTEIGPLQNRQQYQKLLGYLADARDQGKIIAGGYPLDQPGYFIAPTIVRDVNDNAFIVCEEQFGPMLPVLVYDDVDELIERVNNTPYGLGGTVWVNTHLDLPFDIPFGGAKQSGLGREQGQAGLEEFTQVHIVNIAKG